MFSYKLFSNSFYLILYYFALYSFCGWCIEVIYAYFKNHKFVNRGFLYGPFCPMYGFGAVAIVSMLSHSQGNIIVLFIICTLLTTAVEYFTGLTLEKIFHSKWWDYSDDILNYKGRIALPYSILWGILSLFIIKVIHPFFKQNSAFTTSNKSITLLNILFIYFIADFIATLISVAKLEILLAKINLIYAQTKGRIELAKENSSVNLDISQIISPELKSQYENTVSNIHKNYSRLIKAFPEFTTKKVEALREDLKNKINQLKRR